MDIKEDISALDVVYKETEISEMEMTIKEECIDIKSEEDEEESSMPISQLNNHKEAENDSLEVKCTSKGDTGSENFKCYLESIRQSDSKVHQSAPQHKTRLNVKIHTCDACEYKTMCKGHFNAHCMRHKDSLCENKYYKCAYENINRKFIPKYSSSSLKTNRSSGAQLHTCSMCDFRGYSASIAVHRQLKHKDCLQVYKQQASSKAPLYKCGLCDFETNTRASFNLHHLKHRHSSELKLYTRDCKKNLPSHQIQQVNFLKSRMYECYIYNFTIQDKTVLAHHQLKYVLSQAQGYRCDSCNYHTQRKTYFKCHILKHIMCSNVQMYKCNSCVYETEDVMHFERHLVEYSAPTEAQMNKCDEYQTKLKSDQLTHNYTVGIVHKCHRCDYESKEMDKLLNHLLKHGGPSGVRSCKCEMCDVETLHQYRQLRHDSWEMQVSRCNVCGFETSAVSKKNAEDANVQLSIPAIMPS